MTLTENPAPAGVVETAETSGSCWTATSPSILQSVEKKLLSFLKTPYKGSFVDIPHVAGKKVKPHKIWTLSLNTESRKTPLVMLHGLGAGVAFWILNLDSLSSNRPVYAIDTLGFGRSSRPTFSTDPKECEKEYVESIEEWRKEMKIPEFILLGHSMGGFLASSYALSYPDRVKHLILADPWGYPEQPKDANAHLPLWIRAIASALKPFNPLWAIRAAGPWGQRIVEKMRSDITRKFTEATQEENASLIPQYIHQCNAQKPSGESAFHTMMQDYAWAKNPMINRIHELKADVPMTFIYGAQSWLQSSSKAELRAERPHSRVSVRYVNNSGHHVYADNADVFNYYVNEACSKVDASSAVAEKASTSGRQNVISNSNINQEAINNDDSQEVCDVNGNNNLA